MSKISQRIETIEDVRKAVPDVLGNMKRFDGDPEGAAIQIYWQDYLCSLVERAYVCGKRDGAGDAQ